MNDLGLTDYPLFVRPFSIPETKFFHFKYENLIGIQQTSIAKVQNSGYLLFLFHKIREANKLSKSIE